jgi:hypothetical protein
MKVVNETCSECSQLQRQRNSVAHSHQSGCVIPQFLHTVLNLFEAGSKTDYESVAAATFMVAMLPGKCLKVLEFFPIFSTPWKVT